MTLSSYLVETDLSIGDFEDGITEFLVLLNGLISVLALIGEFHTGHRHLAGRIGACWGRVKSLREKEGRWAGPISNGG